MKKRQDNIVFYAAMSGVGVAFLLFIIPNFIKKKTNAAIGPEAFPQLVTLILIALCLVGLVMEYRELKAEGGSFSGYRIDFKAYLPQALFLLSGVAFLMAAPVLGFAVAAIPFLLFLLYFFGSKKLVVNVVISVAYPIALYLIFSQVLRISFPVGILGF